MQCHQAGDRISDYLDGKLSEEERAAFENHIEKCEWCRDLVEEYRRALALAGQLREDAPPALLPNVMQKVHQVQARQKRGVRRRVVAWAASAAAVLALSVTAILAQGGLNLERPEVPMAAGNSEMFLYAANAEEAAEAGVLEDQIVAACEEAAPAESAAAVASTSEPEAAPAEGEPDERKEPADDDVEGMYNGLEPKIVLAREDVLELLQAAAQDEQINKLSTGQTIAVDVTEENIAALRAVLEALNVSIDLQPQSTIWVEIEGGT